MNNYGVVTDVAVESFFAYGTAAPHPDGRGWDGRTHRGGGRRGCLVPGRGVGYAASDDPRRLAPACSKSRAEWLLTFESS